MSSCYKRTDGRTNGQTDRPGEYIRLNCFSLLCEGDKKWTVYEIAFVSSFAMKLLSISNETPTEAVAIQKVEF